MIDIHFFYEMRVLQRDGAVFFDRVTINVSGAAPDPPARTRWEVVNYDAGRMRFLIAAPIAPLQAVSSLIVTDLSPSGDNELPPTNRFR